MGRQKVAPQPTRASIPRALKRTEPFTPEDFGEPAPQTVWPLELRRYLGQRFAHVANDPGDWLESAVDWVPRVMFVMVPVYALLLGLVYATIRATKSLPSLTAEHSGTRQRRRTNGSAVLMCVIFACLVTGFQFVLCVGLRALSVCVVCVF